MKTSCLTSVSVKNEVYAQPPYSQSREIEDGNRHSCTGFDYYGVMRTIPKFLSYMGVFRLHIYPEKCHRTNIMFYHYQGKIFASLHFTGSRHYNQSICKEAMTN